MQKYSLRFLQRDWDGAGFDFCVAVVFDASRVNAQTTKAFLLRLLSLADVSMKFVSADSPDKWKFVPKLEVPAFVQEEFDWQTTLSIVADVVTTHHFHGYVELIKSSQLVIGGPSQNFYQGSIEDDEAVASDIIQFVETAIESFGDGYGCFGVESNAITEALEMKKSKSDQRLAGRLTSLSSDIVMKCREIRELNTIDEDLN